MKRYFNILTYIAIATLAMSCMGTAYIESTHRQAESIEVAAEGDTIWLRLVDQEWAYTTRFEPGYEHKHYRYRIIEDGFAGEESADQSDASQLFVFEPNVSGARKEYRIEVKIAKDYHDGQRGCRPSDKFGNWQTAYNITQPSM